MNNTSYKRTVIVGLFVSVGLLFFIVGILMVGNLHETFKRKIKVLSLFEDVSGLQTGNNIWFSGVKIGVVSNLQFYGNSLVVVTMKIETKAKQYIRKDAMVKISTDGLIGNKILVIYGGTSKYAAVNEGDTLLVEKAFSTEDMMGMLQQNNENLLSITNDFKTISRKIVAGEGSVGKLLNNNDIYNNINDASISLKNTTATAQQLINAVNKNGTLFKDLVSDTTIFNSIKTTALNLEHISDTAQVFINNLNVASTNKNTAIGLLLHDKETGTEIKNTIKNLEISSQKLNESLEALQHSFLLRGFFKKKAKATNSIKQM